MSKKGNILILSAGRRVELIQDFKTEAAKFSDGIRILTTDMNPRMSSACHVSDGAFSVPSIQSEDYIDRIFDLAVEEDIGLIIPTIDTELYKLSEARTRFEEAGIHIVISDSELVAYAATNARQSGCLPATVSARPKFTTATVWFIRVSSSPTTAAAPSAPGAWIGPPTLRRKYWPTPN